MENEMARISIKVTKEVKEWYQQEAKKYGMAMGSLMTFVITKNYENLMAAETMKDMNTLIKEAKEDSPTLESNKELMAQFSELMTMIKTNE